MSVYKSQLCIFPLLLINIANKWSYLYVKPSNMHHRLVKRAQDFRMELSYNNYWKLDQILQLGNFREWWKAMCLQLQGMVRLLFFPSKWSFVQSCASAQLSCINNLKNQWKSEGHLEYANDCEHNIKISEYKINFSICFWWEEVCSVQNKNWNRATMVISQSNF